MNFNRSQNPDYKLKERHINELINLYGIEADYVYTTKENQDKIMRDFSHLKTGDSVKVMLLPEEMVSFEEDLNWDMFGLNSMRTMHLYISKESIYKLFPEWSFDKHAKDIVNSLVVFPSEAIMEISDITTTGEGINNLFTYNDEESVYRLSMRNYYVSQQDTVETQAEQSETVEETFDDLDAYFHSLDNMTDEIEEQGSEISDSDSVFGNLG